MQRPIVFIATPDDSVAVAIVAGQITPVSAGSARDEAELHHTQSVAEALGVLASSRAVRKALIITTADSTEGAPGNVFVQRVVPQNVEKAVVEARNRYAIGFASAGVATTTPVVVLNQPSGLPVLKPIV